MSLYGPQYFEWRGVSDWNGKASLNRENTVVLPSIIWFSCVANLNRSRIDCCRCTAVDTWCCSQNVKRRSDSCFNTVQWILKLRMRRLVLWLMEFVNLCRLVFGLLEYSIPTVDILPIWELTKARLCFGCCSFILDLLAACGRLVERLSYQSKCSCLSPLQKP